ncbi:MAG: Rha family transcriptional regulator [Pseudodesulfovibrio sp.]|uniref:Rha family transcriptional regulator n=1 Tax=Pseudodesulfovibrio sp. TaxID=2035812 RepID=UPI003D109481
MLAIVGHDYQNDSLWYSVYGKATTTSLKVAEVFGKKHFHVLRDIENLDCSEDFRASNFGLTEIEVQAGTVKRKSPVYHMTRDGFVFLAMGFNGKRAAQFKEKYIEAFNKMEQTLNDPVALRMRLSHLEVLEMAGTVFRSTLYCRGQTERRDTHI